jgi:rfaE bifunctional protein kinase chain/domain/rfaE bifunctional protein nucleotidyltransferase chain/domain
MPLADLAEVLAAARAAGRRVVQCHGCFDLLHIGHIRYLQKAAKLGDVLVVTVTPDRFVNKGPHRPAFPEALRAEALAALDCVDYVAINEWPTAVECLALLRPHLYAKGAEFRDNRTPEIIREEAALAELGGEIAYIEDLTSSSSRLLNELLSPFPEEVDRYLDELGERYGAGGILPWVEEAQPLRALVVGETIIEEYHHCETLQRSAHAPVLAVRYLSHERFLGGAGNVANHLAGFCGEVGLLTLVGSEPAEAAWLQSQLRDNVTPLLLRREDSPTLTRRQYRESYFAQPLLEYYLMNEEPLAEADDRLLGRRLAEALPNYDLVVVADYGHALLTPAAIEALCAGARHLTVNTQVDAANLGYHSVGRYPRADYVTLAEQELRLECRSREEDCGAMVAAVAQRLCASRAIAMRGGRGCVGYGPEEGLHEAPALAVKVVDRAGATDAFLAITALCAARGAPLDVTCFLGNVAGAEAVATVGTREPLGRLSLRRHVETLFK